MVQKNNNALITTVVPKPIIAKIKRSGFVIISTDLDHAIIKKKSKINLGFYCFATSLKNVVNVPSKSEKQKKM